MPICELYNVEGEDELYETRNIMGCNCDCDYCIHSNIIEDYDYDEDEYEEDE